MQSVNLKHALKVHSIARRVMLLELTSLSKTFFHETLTKLIFILHNVHQQQTATQPTKPLNFPSSTRAAATTGYLVAVIITSHLQISAPA